MRVLAVDTASRVCSVAVVENQGLLAELTVNHGHTHSTHLMPMIDLLLSQCRLSVHDLDGFAVTIGPGSFTGLRIGLSTIKGLAFATGKPACGVSALEVLAWQFPCAGRPICPMLDARKGEVYAAGYTYRNGAPVEVWPAAAVPPEDAVAGISAGIAGDCLFVGNGARLYQDKIAGLLGRRAAFAPAGQDDIRAATVGKLGTGRLSQGQFSPLDQLNPWYIRPSDAEQKNHDQSLGRANQGQAG